MKKNKLKFKPGDKYGLLTVQEEVINSGKNRLIKCICECGSTRLVRPTSLNKGTVLNCSRFKHPSDENKGIFYVSTLDQWSSYAYVGKSIVNLGLHDTKADATKARLDYESNYKRQKLTSRPGYF